MKSLTHASVCIIAGLSLAGCQPKSGDIATIAETVIVGPEYSPNKGLYVPEETRRSLGLKIVDVGEQKLPATVEVSLRVYEVRGDAVLASGTLPVEEAKGLKIGQSLRIHAANDQSVVGKITAVREQMQKSNGSVEVLAEWAKTPNTQPGAFLVASVMLDRGESVPAVPRSAVVQSTEGSFVYTVSGKHFVRTPVKLGAMTADAAEIKEGLYAGDQVVAEPAMSLWLTELAAIKGGHACCVVPAKGK